MISKDQFVQQYKRAAARHAVKLPRANQLDAEYEDYLFSLKILGSKAKVRFSLQPQTKKLVWEAREP